jgi:lipopolysaccharide export system permease protein
MRTLERYFFRQVINPVIGAILALTAIALLSQSLSQFDLVVERGQSAWVFLKVTLFSLPQLAGIVFPLGIFVGTLVAITRLHGEHEIVAAYTSGMSLSKLSNAVFRIGIYLMLLGLFSNLFVQPIANREMRKELFRIKNDLVSTLVREGEFSTSETGLTIYVQRIDQNNHLKQIFIRAKDDTEHDRTYSAKEGRILTKNGTTILIMRNGSTQQLNDKGILEHLTFEDYSFDITSYFTNDDYLTYKTTDRYLHELFFPNLDVPENRKDRVKLLAEAHSRLSAPLYSLTFAYLALISVLGGAFSRNGYGLRITAVTVIASTCRIMGVVMTSICSNTEGLNIMQYVMPVLPIWICIHLIWRNDKNAAGKKMQLSSVAQMAPLHVGVK